MNHPHILAEAWELRELRDHHLGELRCRQLKGPLRHAGNPVTCAEIGSEQFEHRSSLAWEKVGLRSDRFL